MSWQWVGRATLWSLTILLASLGGAMLHDAVHAYGGDRGFTTFFGLLCVLTAAAIYSRKLR